MLDRYGAEIEYDFLSLLRIDVTEFFQGTRGWLQFLRLLRQLPRDSRFQSAWHSDPEAAREYLEQNPELVKTYEPKKKNQVRQLSDWTPEVELLTALVNEIRGYRADYAHVSSQGKGARKKPEIVPGPKTALEIELAKTKQDQHSSLRAALVPHRYRG